MATYIDMSLKTFGLNRLQASGQPAQSHCAQLPQGQSTQAQPEQSQAADMVDANPAAGDKTNASDQHCKTFFNIFKPFHEHGLKVLICNQRPFVSFTKEEESL
ncbi:MAG: hypothetical protein EOP04_04000 [Proteobacteria bacterium]|nr:MAG: hypothetical protein EOP04_04000 [Pseudomonadota bacterium]